MTKIEYIHYWRITAEKDWVVVENLFEKENYPQAIFFAHLTLEKLLKAHWVKDNVEDIPPRVHNLVWLAERTQLIFDADEISFLEKMTIFQSQSRYPDYSLKLYTILNKKRSEELFIEIQRLKIWLLTQL